MQYLAFEDCIEKIKTPIKIPKSEYQLTGAMPIVAQERDLVNGYTDRIDGAFSVDTAVLIFGDHTCALKYINFDFVLGADGAKIIKPKSNIDSKFFFYLLTAYMPKSTGYARHYRFLKELVLPVPPLAEQQRIVAKLDAAFVEIDRAVDASTDALLMAAELERLFMHNLVDPQKFDDKQITLLEELASFQSGGTPSKNEPTYWGGDIPWISAKDLKTDFLTHSIDTITPLAVQQGGSKLAKKGTLLVLVRGMGLLNGVAIGELGRDCAFNQDIKAIVPKAGLLSRFLLLTLKARFQNLDSYLTSAAHGTRKIEFEKIRTTKVINVDRNLQEEIVSLYERFCDHLRAYRTILAYPVNADTPYM